MSILSYNSFLLIHRTSNFKARKYLVLEKNDYRPSTNGLSLVIVFTYMKGTVKPSDKELLVIATLFTNARLLTIYEATNWSREIVYYCQVVHYLAILYHQVWLNTYIS